MSRRMTSRSVTHGNRNPRACSAITGTGSRGICVVPRLALEIMAGLCGCVGVLARSRRIRIRPVHLVPEKRHDRDDHNGAHEQRRREHRQILHSPPVLSGSCPAAPVRLARELAAAAQRNPGQQDADLSRGQRDAAAAVAPTTHGNRSAGHNRSSMRVFPSVLGFTRSRSRNSATPSS